VISGGADRCARLFNPLRRDPIRPSSPLLIKSYEGAHGHGLSDICIAQGNAKFATCGGDKLAFYWDVHGSVLRRFKGHNEKVNAVAFNEDGTLLFSGSDDRSVRIFDLRAQGRVPVQILDEARDAVMSVFVSSFDVLVAGMDGTVRTYDLRRGECYADSVGEAVTGMAVTKDMECILAMTLDDSVRLLDKSSGKQLNAYYGHVHHNYHMRGDLSHDDAQVVMGSEDGKIYVYDFLTAQVIHCWDNSHAGCVMCVRASPKSALFASTAYDGSLQVFGNPSKVQT